MTMENYHKGQTVEADIGDLGVFSKNLSENVTAIKVRGGSKIQEILDMALVVFEKSDGKETSLVFHGAGPSITKAVSCAEILKRRVKNLHQITKISFQEVVETWNPKFEGLNVIQVKRKVPTIHILVSSTALDKTEPGYQDY